MKTQGFAWLYSALLFSNVAICSIFTWFQSTHRSSIEKIFLDIDSDCMTRSLALQNLTVQHTRIIEGNGTDGEDSSVVFQLQNSAIGIEGECAAHGAALAVNGTDTNPYMVYDCFMESRDPTNVSAMFQYDVMQNKLTINETWVCDDKNYSQPYVSS